MSVNISTEQLTEVLEYGPICAINEEFGVFVTVNGSYLNFWVMEGNANGECTCTTCSTRDKDLYKTTGAEMIDEAEAYLKEVLKENYNEVEDD
jgi:hypothetical protein